MSFTFVLTTPCTAFISQLDEDFGKSGQNQDIEQFASAWTQRGVLYLRLCLNQLKDEGDDVMEDLCTATLPIGVGIGFAQHNMDGNISEYAESSSDCDDMQGSSSSGNSSSVKSTRKPRASKRSRTTKVQDELTGAARAIKEASEARSKRSAESTRHEHDRAQAVSTYVSTVVQLMNQRKECDTEEEKEMISAMIADVQKRMAGVQ